MSNEPSITDREVNWDKIPADENGNKAIDVGASRLDCVMTSELGEVPASVWETAREEVRQFTHKAPTFDQTVRWLKIKRESRLKLVLPIKEGIWQLGWDDGEPSLLCEGDCFVIYCERSDLLRKYAEQLARLADKVAAAGF
jgi:hypothetical protein